MTCPLCFNNAKLFYNKTHYKCECCSGVFKAKEFHLIGEDEKNIYEKHKNDSSDIRYQNFLSPITNSVLKDKPNNSIGLDFGCGKDSAIINVLKDNAYEIHGYDLFYLDDKGLLEQKYDYITSSEVIEHFQEPNKEFTLLKSLLKDDGSLYLMTDIYDEKIDFDKWYYKNDPTHIFMYQRKTFEWIKGEFGFSRVEIEGRLIRFYL
ncbi:MAG: class I SAM-dependent methyltransferase [Arcobacter sp.]|uniref:class I SAM-dependent methyltransferase n=1 Tax=Arcobacter sp. TaxID=1872629 RepID=UPI003AFFD5C1